MSFNANYVFGRSNVEVVIRHPQNKYLRINANNRDQVGPNGGTGPWARWIVETLEGGSRCKIKSKSTGKYLRIEPNASQGAENKIDVKGIGGKWTVFKVHKQGQPGVVKLESAEQPGKYLAVQNDNKIRVGGGGKFTVLAFFREGGGGGGQGGGQVDVAFNAKYVFGRSNVEVVIRHPQNKYLRINPNNKDEVGPNGGTGGWARWIVETLEGGSRCKIKSKATGKYLRIEPNASQGADNKIDVKGTGGKWTVFKVHKQGQPNVVKLESAEQPGKYLAVQNDNKIRVGGGGKFTVLAFFREGGGGGGGGGAEFSKEYVFGKTNTVVIQHKGGSGGNNQHTKFLRVNPNQLGELNPDGAKGALAQWEADPQNGGKQVRFKSLKTGKYLRIHDGGNKIDVGGTGGVYTVFNVLRQGNGTVKLQSNKFGNAYIAVGPNNVIRPGNGGPFTVLKIFRKH